MTEAPVEFVSDSVVETIELGRKIGRCLGGGEVIALIGELGTGKTHLIKGIAAALSPDETNNAGSPSDTSGVSSPTFTLINEYPGRLVLHHVDAYRLENPAELEVLGFDELCRSGGVVVVEWADRVWPIVQPYAPICVYLDHAGQSRRRIRLGNVPLHMQGLASQGSMQQKGKL